MDEDWAAPAGDGAEPDDGADPGAGEEEFDDPDGMTNERFRSLQHRSLFADDAAATDELCRWLLGKFTMMAKAVPPQDRDDLVSDLLEKSWEVARDAIEDTIRKPRNYVMRAASFAFHDFLRRQYRTRRELAASDRPRSPTAVNDDVDNLALVHRFKRRFGQHETGFKIAQVIELLYVYSLNLTEAEACKLLNFGRRETDTVLRTLRRWRSTPGSPLYDLVHALIERG